MRLVDKHCLHRRIATRRNDTSTKGRSGARASRPFVRLSLPQQRAGHRLLATARRFIVIRRPVPDEPSWQLSLFRLGKFVYQVIVTNLDLPPLKLWRFYNARAEVELVIRELKEAYALGKIPSREWQVNEAYFQLVVFAYNLLNWFRRLCVPAELQRWNLPTLRHHLLLVPGELVRPQGSPVLKLPPQLPPSTGVLEHPGAHRRIVGVNALFTPDSG